MLRRFIPKSLYARVALIVILPIFLMQSVITYVFFARHWDLVTANLSRTTAGQVSLITHLWEDAPDEAAQSELIDYSREVLEMSLSVRPNEAIPQGALLAPLNFYNRVFDARLRSRMDNAYWLNTQGWESYVEVRVQTGEDTLVFLILRDRIFATTGPIFIVWLIGTTILLGWIAIVFLRNQVRSILQLAAAAEDFGRGRDSPGFRPSGATEVRRAGRAFIAMRERIKRYLDQRTTMLAGVSHDLKTPLTRMKLVLAMEPDAQDIENLRNDVDEMQRMIDGYLAFSSDVASVGEPVDIEVEELLRDIAEGYEEEADRLTVAPCPGLMVEARPGALKRAITNLVSNGLKYAPNVWVSAAQEHGVVEFFVDDDGPGIPPERHAEAFKPFQRLDEARNQTVSGVGLGLAIVREVARSHGGEIRLGVSPQGGLRATLRIPT